MFFTHTLGYRIGTCVIGFVCAYREDCQRTRSHWRYLLFTRHYRSSSDRRRLAAFFRRGCRKTRKNTQNLRRELVETDKFETAFWPRAGAATSPCARSSPRTAWASGSRRDHRAHAIQFSETGSRARSPSGPNKGSSRIFSSFLLLLLLLLLFYYDFIVIQIRRRSDPGKEKYTHDGYPPLPTHIAILPTHVL